MPLEVGMSDAHGVLLAPVIGIFIYHGAAAKRYQLSSTSTVLFVKTCVTLPAFHFSHHELRGRELMTEDDESYDSV